MNRSRFSPCLFLLTFHRRVKKTKMARWKWRLEVEKDWQRKDALDDVVGEERVGGRGPGQAQRRRTGGRHARVTRRSRIYRAKKIRLTLALIMVEHCVKPTRQCGLKVGTLTTLWNPSITKETKCFENNLVVESKERSTIGNYGRKLKVLEKKE